MAPRHRNHDRRTLLDAKLTELMLYAKELCPEAVVEASTIQYDDEEGPIRVFSPPTLSEAEEERIEMALGARAGEIFDMTGLFIFCTELSAAIALYRAMEMTFWLPQAEAVLAKVEG